MQSSFWFIFAGGGVGMGFIVAIVATGVIGFIVAMGFMDFF